MNVQNIVVANVHSLNVKKIIHVRNFALSKMNTFQAK